MEMCGRPLPDDEANAVALSEVALVRDAAIVLATLWTMGAGSRA